MKSPVGVVKLEIPFTGLEPVVYVDFIVLEEDLPTLMYIPEIYLNGLVIYVQNKRVTHGNCAHALML